MNLPDWLMIKILPRLRKDRKRLKDELEKERMKAATED